MSFCEKMQGETAQKREADLLTLIETIKRNVKEQASRGHTSVFFNGNFIPFYYWSNMKDLVKILKMRLPGFKITTKRRVVYLELKWKANNTGTTCSPPTQIKK